MKFSKNDYCSRADIFVRMWAGGGVKRSQKSKCPMDVYCEPRPVSVVARTSTSKHCGQSRPSGKSTTSSSRTSRSSPSSRDGSTARTTPCACWCSRSCRSRAGAPARATRWCARASRRSRTDWVCSRRFRAVCSCIARR